MDTNKVKSALIVVDVQNDFCEGGSLAVSNANQILPIVKSLIECGKFDEIFYTQDWHPQNHWSFASNHQGAQIFTKIQLDYSVEQMLWPNHCVQGTNGAEFHKDIPQPKAEQIVQKGKQKEVDSYSGFGSQPDITDQLLKKGYQPEKTSLLNKLQEKKIKKVFCVGLALDYCVQFTATDAFKNGFESYIIDEATKAVDAGNVENIKKDIQNKNVKIISMKGFEQYLK